MFLRLTTLLFVLVFSFIHCTPPQLTPRDTRVKIDEILKAHVSYQQLTTDLVKRSLQNYLEELDPNKSYFIDSEIVKWTSPSDELLTQTLQGYRNEDFKTFQEIHQTMISAIKRRNELEKKINTAPLPKDVKPSEFKDIGWAKNEEELTTRLIRIKALQTETSQKIGQETKDQFLPLIAKRRLNREGQISPASPAETDQVILSYVLKATSSALDSQTAYFTPAEANQFMSQVQQRLFGIGALLRDDLSGFSIIRLVEGGPALMSNKLKVNDKIVAVNGMPVAGMDISEAVELIRGEQGTSVLLTILRESGEEEQKKEERLDVEIVRGEIVLKESRLESTYEPFGNGVIGIFHLYSFYQDGKSSSTSDLRDAITKLKNEQDVKGIILDLRNNAGGLLPQAVSVTGLFISKGVVVSVKDNTGEIQRLRNIENKIVWDGPLVVLTNRTSASASEIVAQALQDYGRAIVVGDPETYGKGTFQTFTLEANNYGKVNPKGEYKVTRGRYYTVSGKSPQLVGVKPSFVVPGLYSQMEIGEKHSKFPLGNDQIPPSFNDDLTDIPSSYRKQIGSLYKFNLQPVLHTYEPYLDTLKKNSAQRIELNKNYQSFIKELAKNDPTSEPAEIFGQSDLQLNETINIMKDLIILQKQNPAAATAA